MRSKQVTTLISKSFSKWIEGRRAIAARAIEFNFGNFIASALRAIARDVDSSCYVKELIPVPRAKKYSYGKSPRRERISIHLSQRRNKEDFIDSELRSVRLELI